MDFKLKKLNTSLQVSEIANVHFFEFPKGYKTVGDKHPFHELIFVGTGAISVQSEEYGGMLNKNELLLHSANSVHSFSCPKKAETTLIIIGFTCNQTKLFDFAKKPVKLDEPQVKQLAEIVKEARNVFAPPYNVPIYDMVKKKEQLFGSEQMLRSLIETFLIGLIRKYDFFENNELKEETSFTINEILDYIDDTYTEKISLDELAFLFRTNRSTLCKKFKAETGKTLGDYVKNKKLEEAKRLLVQGVKTVTQIADELNFETVPYFCEFFKRNTGLTPSEYQKSLQ